MSPKFYVGPVREAGGASLPAEDREFLRKFCDTHGIPEGEVRSAALLDPAGEPVAVLLVVSMGRIRALVRASPLFGSTGQPTFERDATGWPAAATVRVFRVNSARAVNRTAFWQERVPVEPSPEDVQLWTREPDRLLSELAESLALRAAFPEVLAGVYTRWDLEEAPRDFELALASHPPGPPAG